MAPGANFTGSWKSGSKLRALKRFAQYDIAAHVGAPRFEGAIESRASVWSARSLLPLWLVPASMRFGIGRTGSWKAVFVSGSTAMGWVEAHRPAQKLRCSQELLNDVQRGKFATED